MEGDSQKLNHHQDRSSITWTNVRSKKNFTFIHSHHGRFIMHWVVILLLLHSFFLSQESNSTSQHHQNNDDDSDDDLPTFNYPTTREDSSKKNWRKYSHIQCCLIPRKMIKQKGIIDSFPNNHLDHHSVLKDWLDDAVNKYILTISWFIHPPDS